jgi:hypothetical protein
MRLLGDAAKDQLMIIQRKLKPDSILRHIISSQTLEGELLNGTKCGVASLWCADA